MHDIKYFFLNKCNQTIWEENSIGDGLPKILPKNTIFAPDYDINTLI
jgi:hypothetical protein